MSESVKSAISEFIAKHRKNWFSIYGGANIPPKKLKNAIEAYGKGIASHQVLLLIDATTFGSATNGMLFTEDRLFWNMDHPNMSGCLPFIDINYVDITGDSIFNRALIINNKISIGLPGSCNADAAKGLTNLISNLAFQKSPVVGLSSETQQSQSELMPNVNKTEIPDKSITSFTIDDLNNLNQLRQLANPATPSQAKIANKTIASNERKHMNFDNIDSMIAALDKFNNESYTDSMNELKDKISYLNSIDLYHKGNAGNLKNWRSAAHEHNFDVSTYFSQEALFIQICALTHKLEISNVINENIALSLSRHHSQQLELMKMLNMSSMMILKYLNKRESLSETESK